MKLSKNRDLKERMLKSNPKFMQDRFYSGIDRANDAKRRIEDYFESIKDAPADDAIAKQLKAASQSLSLGLNHAVFTYDPHSPQQVEALKMIMRDANEMIQWYGEDLNAVIHNYPYVAQAFDHIYETQENHNENETPITARENLQQELTPEYTPAKNPKYSYDQALPGPTLSM